jgi:hypothetical protein
MYACMPEIERGLFEGVCAPSNATATFRDPPHSPSQENRSPIARTPARRGSRAALPSAVLWLGVEVNHHPPTAIAPLTSHPRTTLNVVDAPLKASHAGALLIGGTCSLGGHDLTPSSRLRRGRNGHLSCGSRQAYLSCVPTHGNLSAPWDESQNPKRNYYFEPC